MVLHPLQGSDLDRIGLRNLLKERLDGLGHIPNQDILSVLGGPDDVVLQIINGMSTCFVGHAGIIPALRAAHFPPHSKLWGIQRDFS
jgi:hypothetical protein